MIRKIIKSAALLFAAFSFLSAQSTNIKLGDEILLAEKFELIKNKNIGLITNTSAVLSDGQPFIDSLLKTDSVRIKSVFALEHGFDLRAGAGVLIKDDYIKQIKVHSLYGQTKKPTPQMMQGLDVIVFDIQDVGARFYTYISSLKYVLEACAENNVEIIVCDRPNPLGGLYVDGPILEDEYKSFVGIDNLPVVHGMTIGEIAAFFNDRIPRRANLTIVKMEGWQRSKYWDELNLTWRSPSPNIINFTSVLLYPAVCYFEGTNISEGRGTYTPFNIIGAPFINARELRNVIEKELNGVIEARAIEFVPVSIEDMAMNPKYKGDICSGVQLVIKDRKRYKPVETGVKLISIMHKLYPDKFEMTEYFDLLWGTNSVKSQILAGKEPEQIINSWQEKLNRFKELRNNYLLY